MQNSDRHRDLMLDVAPQVGSDSELFRVRRGTPYTEAERRYSLMVQQCLEDLLQATRKTVVLLRRHYGGRDRTTVLAAPRGVDRAALRAEVVERILCATMGFIRSGAPGGPIFQQEEEGFMVETQMFATRYPHIVIERIDIFAPDRNPVSTEWRLRRTQNQKVETQINRWLEVADLGVHLLKTVAGVK